MSDYPPQEGPVEDDFVISSRGAKRGEVDQDVCVSVLLSTATWPHGAYTTTGRASPKRPSRDSGCSSAARGAPSSSCTALVRSTFPPRWCWNPSTRWTSSSTSCSSPTFTCAPRTPCTSQTRVRSPYCHLVPHVLLITLDDTAGDKVSLALVSQTPVTAAGTAESANGFTWWHDAPNGLLRKACDQTGKARFTPLYALRRQIKRNRRFFRDKIRPEPEGDDLSV